MKKEKDIKKLLKEKELDKEKLLALILEVGEEQAIEKSVSLAKELDKESFMKLIDAFNCADENLRNSFFREIILCSDIYFPYKEIIINKINQNEYFMKSEIFAAIEESRKKHWAILRSLEEKKFSEEFFNNIIKNHIDLIEKYVRDYIDGNIKQAEWLFSYYGKEDGFDEILLRLLKEHSIIETVAIIEKILKKGIPKEKIKELKKIKYVIENQVKNMMQNFLEEAEIAKIYKAWMTPYNLYNYITIIIMNYLPNTDQYIYFLILLHNLRIKEAFVNTVKQGKQKMLIKQIEKRFLDNHQSIFEVDPSFILHYINLIIKNYKKRNVALPEELEKYLPALLVKYNKSKRNPLQKIYGKDNLYLYQDYYNNLFDDQLFLGWCMKPELIKSLQNKLLHLNGKFAVIKFTNEQLMEKIQELITDFLNGYWTEKRLRFLAFKLLVNSYYYYKNGKDFLSRICYDAYKETLDKNIEPSKKKFIVSFFELSYKIIEDLENSKLKNKRILKPEEAKKLILFPKDKINNDV